MNGQPLAKMNKSLIDACIHCGLCLPACPTYLATGREMESPRGRIHLLGMVLNEQTPITARIAEHIESCLGCLGCQTACPSGVQYEQILNQARPALASLRNRPLRRLLRFVFARVLADYGKLKLLGTILRFWQKAGMRQILQALPDNLFQGIKIWQELLPCIPEYMPLPKRSWIPGQKGTVVQFFSGCVMDIFYNQVNHACLRLLTMQRRVVAVPEQTCCGALAFHAGELDIALTQARRNIELMEASSGEIVVSAAGCGAMLKSYGELLADDPIWAQRARAFCRRVVDISQYLLEGSFCRAPRSFSGKVAYHAACHLVHAQKVAAAPGQLLKDIPGLTIVPLEEAEHCCGSAGIFNLTHTALSMKVLERKVNYLKESGCDLVVTTNPGCLLQLEYGITSAGLKISVKHLAELLDEVYSLSAADSEIDA